MNEKIPIGVVSQMLGVNIQTLRRWDDDGSLNPDRSASLAHRYYTENQIGDFLSNNYKYLEKASREWAFGESPTRIISKFHCPDKSIFKARLSRLELLLSRDEYLSVDYKFSLVTSIVGEIGNNAFDHNIGMWPDATGVFFGYSLSERKIILADRGQGILTTLVRVKPELLNHKEALRVAFTEYISGRAPENRGNGLKFVREVIVGKSYDDTVPAVKIETLGLDFQSGDGKVIIKYDSDDLNIQNVEDSNKGCFILLKY